MSGSLTKDRERKIQGYVAPYYKWALQRLVDLGFEGLTLNDAVSNIVQRWLDGNADEHRRLGITKEAYLAARNPVADRPPGSETKAKLYRLDQHGKRRLMARHRGHREPERYGTRGA